MAVMIITVGISSGFQREIRSKVVGAGSHIQVVSIGQNDPKETPRVLIDPELTTELLAIPGVRHVQIHATKPGIIETAEEIEGVVVKGVGADFDWAFWNAHIVEGTTIDPLDSASTPGVLLSRYLAKRLAIGVSDTITIYLVKGREDIRPRKFAVKGLYETGLEKIDHQLVFIGIGVMQRFAQWGLRAEILVTDTPSDAERSVEALAFGETGCTTMSGRCTPLKGAARTAFHMHRRRPLVFTDRQRHQPDTARHDDHQLPAPPSPIRGEYLASAFRGGARRHRWDLRQVLRWLRGGHRRPGPAQRDR
ncbi:MAG: ABC transporter permease [Flavobacteriales bacterium]|nr:ABC transporter permease [Flavobacteriales bacterium]